MSVTQFQVSKMILGLAFNVGSITIDTDQYPI
jgi:hypothetical protein